MSQIKKLTRELNEGLVSSVQLVEASLKKIEEKQKTNSYISVFREEAVKKAQEIDAKRKCGEKVGKLAGIPIAIKDNICVDYGKTTCASKMLENFESLYNATVVERILAEDGIIIGKTNMDEFAMGSTSESSHFGNTLNPQNKNFIPGGSSGGSAAAVADDTVYISLGSDTGGSIRQPAACCGVVGLKPTYGRVSRYGLVSYASSLDQIGPITQTVEDSAILLNIIAGHDKNDSTTSQQPTEDYTSLLEEDIAGKTIGVPREYFSKGLDATHKAELEKVLKEYEAKGAILKEISLPHVKYAISSYYILATAEASSNLSRFDGVRYTHRSDSKESLEDLYRSSRSEGFGKEVQKRVLLGTFVLSSGYYDAYYVQAQKVRQLITQDFKKAFEDCDIIAAPTLPGVPLEMGKGMEDPMAMYLSDIYTVSLNLAGLPAISVPVTTIDDMKVGLQFIGDAFKESQVLQFAKIAESIAS